MRDNTLGTVTATAPARSLGMAGVSLTRRVRHYAALTLLVALAVLLWERPLEAHVKTFLLISQVLPQVPFRPLDALTNPPSHSRFTIDSPNGPIVTDLFRPRPHFGTPRAHSQPAIIMAMGVKAKSSDKTLLLGFSKKLICLTPDTCFECQLGARRPL